MCVYQANASKKPSSLVLKAKPLVRVPGAVRCESKAVGADQLHALLQRRSQLPGLQHRGGLQTVAESWASSVLRVPIYVHVRASSQGQDPHVRQRGAPARRDSQHPSEHQSDGVRSALSTAPNPTWAGYDPRRADSDPCRHAYRLAQETTQGERQ